jgi:hypothetical protein
MQLNKETPSGEQKPEGVTRENHSSLPLGGSIIPENGQARQDERERRGKFLAQVFGRYEGYLCLAKIGGKKQWKGEEFFKYPGELENALDWIDENLATYNLYFCAQLLEKPQRLKEHIHKVAQVWADLDPCHPDKLLVPPTISWESSPGRYQAIWRLEELIDGKEAEQLSRRIAVAHKGDGVDQSGWDRTQLLRIPFTYNFKYGPPHPQVTIVDARPGHYRPDDFASYPPAPEDTEPTGEPIPDLDESAAEVLARHRGTLRDSTIRLFNED